MIWVVVLCAVLGTLCAFLYVKLSQAKLEAADEVTRIKEANGQLAAHAANYQQKLKALSESSGAGMVILDRQGKIVHTNSAAERILRVERRALWDTHSY